MQQHRYERDPRQKRAAHSYNDHHHLTVGGIAYDISNLCMNDRQNEYEKMPDLCSRSSCSSSISSTGSPYNFDWKDKMLLSNSNLEDDADDSIGNNDGVVGECRQNSDDQRRRRQHHHHHHHHDQQQRRKQEWQEHEKKMNGDQPFRRMQGPYFQNDPTLDALRKGHRGSMASSRGHHVPRRHHSMDGPSRPMKEVRKGRRRSSIGHDRKMQEVYHRDMSKQGQHVPFEVSATTTGQCHRDRQMRLKQPPHPAPVPRDQCQRDQDKRLKGPPVPFADYQCNRDQQIKLKNPPLPARATMDPRRIQSEGADRDSDNIMVEISPGVSVPLITTEIILQAVRMGHSKRMSCLDCGTELLCMDNTQYVICPDCRVISPTFIDGARQCVGAGLKSEWCVRSSGSRIQGRGQDEEYSMPMPRMQRTVTSDY